MSTAERIIPADRHASPLPVPVLHIIAGLPGLSDGTHCVARFASELASRGHDITLLTLCEPAAALELDARVRVEVHTPARGAARLGVAPGMWRSLRRHATRPVIVHDHGLWLMPNVYAGWIARNPNVRLVVSPHGMLSPWALQYHRWRKRAVWWLLGQRRLLARAATFHATAESEAEEIRRLGWRQPIWVIPNGIDIPAPPGTVLARPGRHRLLFLSRIHPKKGVDLLLRAWKALQPRFPDWELVVAGPDNDGHLEDMRGLARQLGLERISFPGPVYGQAKQDLLFSADLFVLPTRSENFGLVVAEALAHGLPVVTTRAAPWEGLVSRRCGWWIDPDVPALEAALSVAMTLSAEERRAMGERGRDWVRASLSWPQQAQALDHCYRDLWSGMTPPGPRRRCSGNRTLTDQGA